MTRNKNRFLLIQNLKIIVEDILILCLQRADDTDVTGVPCFHMFFKSTNTTVMTVAIILFTERLPYVNNHRKFGMVGPSCKVKRATIIFGVIYAENGV